MTTNPFFNNYGQTSEQELLEDLVVESIRIWGQDMYYLPRKRNSFDGIYYEDSQSSFDIAYMIEVYMKSYNGFMGQDSFMSKFGLEVRDQFVFSIARRSFSLEITNPQPEILRPREGDLLYFPLNRKTFEIRFVDNKPFFYQLGELQMYDITCELFEYSNEKFNTGIEEIDQIQSKLSFNVIDYSVKNEQGEPIKTEDGDYIIKDKFDQNQQEFDPIQDNERIQKEVDDNSYIDWSETNPFGERNRY